MDKKALLKVNSRYFNFLIVTLFSCYLFIVPLKQALSTIQNGGTLNNFQYSIMGFKLNITNGTYNHIYEIGNYPLIPLILGLAYSAYIMVKCYKNKNEQNL